jgi:hypothetical protein
LLYAPRTETHKTRPRSKQGTPDPGEWICENDPDNFRLDGTIGCFSWNVFPTDPENEDTTWKAEYIGCGEIDWQLLDEHEDLVRVMRAVIDRLLQELDLEHQMFKRFHESPGALRALGDEAEASGGSGRMLYDRAEYIENHRQMMEEPS